MKAFRCVALALVGLFGFAAEAAVRDVPSFVERWSARGRRLGLPSNRKALRTVRHEIGGSAPAFHEVRFAGGGFAVVDPSGETGEIIAFSERGEIVEDDKSPLWALLKRHMMLKAAGGVAAKTLGQTKTSAENISDLRVAPLLASKWNQEKAGGKPCYNYYAPNNYPCGCVATAMGQVMRYHRWPERPAKVVTCECFVGPDMNSLTPTNMTMIGGVYGWNSMPAAPGYGVSDAEREAIGHLTYDIGVAMHMAYSAAGSGTPLEPAHLQLKDVFGYRSAYTLEPIDAYGESLDDGEIRMAVLANLDAKCPVLLGIFNYDALNEAYRNGHCIVADGYGFVDEDVFVHLNMGWGGNDDAWYKLPDIGTFYGFNLVDSVAYNIFPDASGAIVSGHVTCDHTNLVGRTVSAYQNGVLKRSVQTDENGVYALILNESTSYEIKVKVGDAAATRSVTTGYHASFTDYDWESGKGKYSVQRGVVCGNRWGNDLELTTPTPVEPPVLHVSAASGDDVTGTGAEDAPFATISAALAKATEANTVVWVGPGTYTDTVVAVSSVVEIRSTDGPEATVIDANGQGICFDAYDSPQARIIGFTLQNGAGYEGSGVWGGVVSNCVIRFCTAYMGYDRDYGYFGGDGGGAYGAELYDTFVYGNGAEQYGGGVVECTLVRCTVGGNFSVYAGAGADYMTTCLDSIVWGNCNYQTGETDNWMSYGGQATLFDHSCTEPMPLAGEGNISGDPLFANGDEADFRLRQVSPCVGAASDGRNMGAYQGTGVPGVQITVQTVGPGTVTPAAVVLTEGETATFVAESNHPFVGFSTNGVTIASTPELTLECPGQDLVLTAQFDYTDFYVDSANGDDANDGWSQEKARRSLGETVNGAVYGETVWVAPGVYDGFSSMAYGVAVHSSEGPAKTVIDAKGGNLCFEDVGWTLLDGFALVNAKADGFRGGGASGGVLLDCVISNCTAGAGGGAADAWLENCVIAGNSAKTQGGGAAGCTLVGCTVFGNRCGATRSRWSELGGGGVDCSCACTNSILWGNLNAAGSSDNWEAYVVESWRGVQTQVPTMDHCCSTPLNSIAVAQVCADPRFVDAQAGDFRLYEISPCIGAGVGGTNIGAYRGPGVRIEIPALPPNPSAQDVTTAVEAVGYADPLVPAYIGSDAARYGSFRTWATDEIGSPTAVALGTKSYLSYAVRDIVASPTLLSDLTKTVFEIPSFAADAGQCELTVRLRDGETSVPLKAAKEAFAAKVRLGVTPDGLKPATAEDVLSSQANGDGTVTLSVRAPSKTSGFYDLNVK